MTKKVFDLKKLYIIALFSVVFLPRIFGQDPQFSQFYSNPLYLGPSFAGAIDGSRLATNYRMQWYGMVSPYHTYSFSFDHYFSNFNSGVGLFMMRDVAGSGNLGRLNLGLQYSYNVQVFDTWHVRPGLHFYYTQLGFDFYKLTFIDELYNKYEYANEDAETNFDPPATEHIHRVDAATSVLVYNERVWGGFTIDHLLMPNYSFYNGNERIPIRYSFYGGVQVVKRSRLLNPIDETLTIAVNYKNQNNQNQLDLGLYWHKQPLVLGGWYRGIPLVNSPRGDAFTFLIGYKVQQFSVGYSYDFTVSNLLAHFKGAHELSMVFKFNMPPRKKKMGAVPCPEF
jgi:type IX secretion system PorP/SprF family membrane protein